jgi:hypothetical protein
VQHITTNISGKFGSQQLTYSDFLLVLSSKIQSAEAAQLPVTNLIKNSCCAEDRTTGG